MTLINGLLGGIGAAIIIGGSILSLADKNKESTAVDSAQLRVIDEGGNVDSGWVEEVRDGARKGLVAPSVARAAASTCGFSDGDLEVIERSYRFWGGKEEGVLGTGCSSWLICVGLISGILCGVVGGTLVDSIFGLWLATFVGICLNDYRFRRIDLLSIGLLALCGVAMSDCVEAVIWRLIQGLVVSVALYLAAYLAERVCGKEAFGLGDVLLLGAIAASATFSTDALIAACAALLVECAAALAVLKIRKSDTALPFAPLAFLPAITFILVA